MNLEELYSHGAELELLRSDHVTAETPVQKHTRKAIEAENIYTAELIRDPGAAHWREVIGDARKEIFDALKASGNLQNVSGALRSSGSHMIVFRHVLAPPLSQDQFKLACASWQKTSEKTGLGLSAPVSTKCEAAVLAYHDRALIPWLDHNRRPSFGEIRRVVHRVVPLIARQRFETVRRNRLANAQENAMVELLDELGWTKMPSKQIDTRAALPSKTYMHKTRFATSTSPQEVDVACGLGRSVVLATECKVTNDKTNSVKRVNDVLKKATAWKEHWGNFVKPAALLQGVINPSDVERLLDAGVEVFWSHDLDDLRSWILDNIDDD